MTAFRIDQLLGERVVAIALPAGTTVRRHFLRDDDNVTRNPEQAPRAPCEAPVSSPGLVEKPDSTNGVGPLEAATLDESTLIAQPRALAPAPTPVPAHKRRKRDRIAAATPKPPSLSQRILAILKDSQPLTARDLCAILDQKINNISVALGGLHARGRVARSRTSHPYAYHLPAVPAWRPSPSEPTHDQP